MPVKKERPTIERVTANGGKWYTVYSDAAGFYKVTVQVFTGVGKSYHRDVWRRGGPDSLTANCAMHAALSARRAANVS